ncbi:MAG: hypothetical protein HC905_08670 [Bacteroidales bacterium]|nr:hypothetical protein [Bacteroidales bacterium]
MKKKYLALVSVIAVSGVVLFYSCKKDDEKTATKSDAVTVASVNLKSDAVYNDLYAESEEILATLENSKYPAVSGSLKSATTNGSRVITVTKNSGDTAAASFPKEITIVYTNYISLNGIKKNGTIKITQSARIRKKDAVRTVSLDNFMMNDSILVEGKKTITNLGLVSGKPTMKVTLENGKITFSGKYYITRSFTRTITWKEGALTPFLIWDDKFAIFEAAKGSSKDGFNYNTKTTDSLEFKLSDLCIKKVNSKSM